ncbi:hypothetical protein [Acidovorax sp. K2F]|uniref:hypothetical protein n=1 Tax=Acidovorax sp. K2F TaxID=2978125 RepID=UPI0021B10061|nr:hypothetical protein [Acidovorax sp. K2F]MCT6721691.1 hypothetical protein [Acidovorax sp. K2F]
MAEEPKKSKGGSKLSRSEITTVRLDPKLRYLAELAARKQRRTLSSFVEWAIEDSLDRFNLREWDSGSITLLSQAESLWDVDEADRLAKLALSFPELLTHDEQIIWKLIKESGYFWRGSFHKVSNEWTWTVQESSLVFERLRDSWEVVKAVAAGDEPPEAMPSWPRRRVVAPPPSSSSGFDDMDADIPF